MKYGRYTVLRECEPRVYPSGKWQRVVEVRCDCGTIKQLLLHNLKNGKSKSCGCWNRERHTLHGKTKSKTHTIWMGMKARCGSPSEPGFKYYGARGIYVCDRWMLFSNFLADMGECPDGLSLERINNDGPYSPENCKWASRAVQNRNRRGNRRITYDGITMCLIDWAERLGIDYSTLIYRVRHWPLERAFREPVGATGHGIYPRTPVAARREAATMTEFLRGLRTGVVAGLVIVAAIAAWSGGAWTALGQDTTVDWAARWREHERELGLPPKRGVDEIMRDLVVEPVPAHELDGVRGSPPAGDGRRRFERTPDRAPDTAG